ncbi:MAG: family 43 glycosylhydrolase [Bacteroidales bacterium]|nr:family 43 glycosylhydrolase [Bacteroidales bacterium]
MRIFWLIIVNLAYTVVFAQSVSFKTYKNPVIHGDHPDCTVSRIGNDYYSTGSSFNLEPQIYHSTDLVHWRVISKPVSASWEGFGDSPGGGCWGGQVVFHHNKYWHFFSRANTMYFTTANQPEGPWTVPVKINNPPQLPYTLGYDNSIFIDDNGKWYLVVKNGQPNNGIVELGENGQPTGVVYNLSWLNPAPSYPYSWAEGPVMWKYKGYYYYSFARDLGGGQKVMRSRELTDRQSSWEMLGDFFNEKDPLKESSLFTGPNHSSAVVMAPDSTFWVIHPLYAKGEWRGQGRQGLLNQVFYDANGKPTAQYPINTSFTAPKLPSSGIPWMVPKSDFFELDKLNPEWQFYGYTPNNLYSLSERVGWLRLSPKSKNRFNLLSKNDGEHNYSLITRVDFEPALLSDEAGLVIMRGDERMFVKLVSTVNEIGRKIIRFSFKEDSYQVDNIFGNTIWLKLERINHSIAGYVSPDGFNWKRVGESFNISEIDSYSDFSTFTGTRQGLYVQGKKAYFDLYIYRDAYSPILAECPANEKGTIRSTLRDGIYLLDSIHHQDWALYAGVEFGNENYPMACDSVEFTVSSISDGSNIEVWLDSIDTGIKVANCSIGSTGDWNSFKSFKAKTKRISGRHDVYLRFVGSSGKRLFQLKWIRFIPSMHPRLQEAKTSDEGNIISLFFTKPILPCDTIEGFSLVVNGVIRKIDSLKIDGVNPNMVYLYPQHPVYQTDTISLSYENGNLISTDSLKLIDFSNFEVKNQVAGSRPVIKRVITNQEGDAIQIEFSKNVIITEAQCRGFILKVKSNDWRTPTTCSCINNDSSKYLMRFSDKFYYEDTLFLSNLNENVVAVNGGVLDAFSQMPVQNISKGYPLNIHSAYIQRSGAIYNKIILKFNKKLLNTSPQIGAFTVKINNVEAKVSSLLLAKDSLQINFYPTAKNGDTISLSYEDGNIQSIYLGELKNFTNYLLLIPTNSKEILKQSNVSVFPNPSNGFISITAYEPIDLVKIYTIQGKEIYRKYIPKTLSTDIKLDLSSGLYFIEVETKSLISKTKILIK